MNSVEFKLVRTTLELLLAACEVIGKNEHALGAEVRLPKNVTTAIAVFAVGDVPLVKLNVPLVLVPEIEGILGDVPAPNPREIVGVPPVPIN